MNIVIAKKELFFRSLKGVERFLVKIGSEIASQSKILRGLTRSLVTASDSGMNIAEVTASPIIVTTPSDKETVQNIKYEGKLPKGIRADISVIYKTRQQLEMLNSVWISLSHHYPEDKAAGSIIKKLDKLKAKAQANLDVAMKVIDDVYRKNYVPADFKRKITAINKYVLESLEGRYDSSHTIRMVAARPRVDSLLEFVHYLQLKDLKTETDYVYENLYVTLTAKVNDSKDVEYYVNVIPKFASPGEFNRGVEFRSIQDAQESLSIMFEKESGLSELFSVKLPVKQGEVKDALTDISKLIEDAGVQSGGEVLLVTLKKGKTARERDKVIKRVREFLYSKGVTVLKSRHKKEDGKAVVYFRGELRDVRESKKMKDRLFRTDEVKRLKDMGFHDAAIQHLKMWV